MRRGWLLAGAGTAAVVLGVGGFLIARPRNAPESTNGNRPGSVVAPGPAVTTGQAPDSYLITYRLEGSTLRRPGTERLTVKRPFEARSDILDGLPPGTGPATVTVAGLGFLSTQPPNEAAFVLAIPPETPSLDLRPEAVLSEAVNAGLLQRRERRVVDGEPCQVYRSANDPAAGVLQPVRSTESSFFDTCVDAHGLVLESLQVSGRKILSRRVAVAVSLGPAIDDSVFTRPGPPAPADQGGGTFRQLEPDSRLPDRFWELPAPPTGSVHVGRFLARPPQPDARSGDPNKLRGLIGGVADVYTIGADSVIIDQGATLGGVAPFEPQPTATPVDLGALGRGELIMSLVGSEVRIDLGKGSYLKVFGTLAPSALVALARQLVAGPGGTLTLAPG